MTEEELAMLKLGVDNLTSARTKIDLEIRRMQEKIDRYYHDLTESNGERVLWVTGYGTMYEWYTKDAVWKNWAKKHKVRAIKAIRTFEGVDLSQALRKYNEIMGCPR